MKILCTQTLKKMLGEKNKALKEVSRQVKNKSNDNQDLDKQLREVQVCVAERAQIEKLAGQPRTYHCVISVLSYHH